MNRRILIATAGASVALLLVWFIALWQPKGSELDAQQERAAAAETTAAELEMRISQLKASQAEGPRLAATLDRLKSAVPDEPQLAQFILDANDAAETADVEFVSIAPSPPAPATEPGLPPQVSLSVSIEGGYFQVLDFVERLVDLNRVVVLDSVNATPGADEGGTPMLSVSLQGRMFTTQLPVPAGTVPAAAPAADGSTTSTTAPTTTTVVPS